MLYFCALCGSPLTPGLRLCQCGQVFNHPVPDFDVQGEPGARYWPPRQLSSAEATFHRAQKWWEGVSNKHKTIAFGMAAVLLVAMIGVGSHSGGAQPYQNRSYNPPTQINQRTVSSPVSVQNIPDALPDQPSAVSVAPTVAMINPGYGLMTADLDDTKHILGICNKDSFDWTNVEIIVNPGYGDYHLYISVIHPWTGHDADGYSTLWSNVVKYEDFSNDYGYQFNSSMVINRIQLTCDTPSGHANYMMTVLN